MIYTIPTSGVTYEFTRMVYEILGLNVNAIAERFTSYDLLKVKNENGDIDFEKIRLILSQKKPFNGITAADEPIEGDDTVKFEAVVGNPPYMETVGDPRTNKSLSKQLFPNFTVTSIKMKPQYVSLITPSRWFTADAQDKSFVKLRQFFKKNNHIKNLVNYQESKDVFDKVLIGSISYFLYDRDYNGDVYFQEKSCKSSNIANRPLFEEYMDVLFL